MADDEIRREGGAASPHSNKWSRRVFKGGEGHDHDSSPNDDEIETSSNPDDAPAVPDAESRGIKSKKSHKFPESAVLASRDFMATIMAAEGNPLVALDLRLNKLAEAKGEDSHEEKLSARFKDSIAGLIALSSEKAAIAPGSDQETLLGMGRLLIDIGKLPKLGVKGTAELEAVTECFQSSGMAHECTEASQAINGQGTRAL